MGQRNLGHDWDESDIRIRPNKRGSRPRTKIRPAHVEAAAGRVVGVDRGRYTVIVEEGTPAERLIIAARARQPHRSPVVVGDFVALVGDLSGAPGTLARMVRIEPRRTVLRRSADDSDAVERIVVANADVLVIVVAAADPEPRTGFIDRALVAAYDAGLHPLLLVTKTDLRYPEELLEHYAQLDMDVLLSTRTSDVGAQARHGLEESLLPPSLPLGQAAVSQLRQALDGRVSVLLGHSGVGKSTMVNALTGASRATGGVNTVTGRGRHTSSSAVALRIPGAAPGSWIVDTPGIRSFGLAHVDPGRMLRAFPELESGIEHCPRGCSHLEDAPECGLDLLVGEGLVDDGGSSSSGPERLASFRRLLTAVRAVQEPGTH